MATHEHILTLDKSRAKEALSRITASYERGELSHESDLLRGLTEEFAGVYLGLTEPTITPEVMRVGELLRMSAIETPLKQLGQDLDTFYEQLGLLDSAVATTGNLCAVERAGLEELLSSAKDGLTTAEAWASNANPLLLWCSDTFQGDHYVDQALTSAWVNKTLGLVTLGITGESSLSSRISSVSIQHSQGPVADGLPGNWLELSSSGQAAATVSEISEPVSPPFANLSYKDSSNPSAMFDGDPTTWFEWEKYLVPKAQYLTPRGSAWVVSDSTSGVLKDVFGPNGVTKDYGWEYIIRWPGSTFVEDSRYWVVKPTSYSGDPEHIGDEESLRFSMEVQFDDAQELSWIELLPYLPANITYTLKNLYVSPDGAGTWIPLVSQMKNPIVLNARIDQPINYQSNGIPVKDLKGTAVVPCSINKVKSLRIELEQQIPYKTTIAHKYFLKHTYVTDTDAKWYGGSSTKTYWEHNRTESNDLESSGSESASKAAISGTIGSTAGWLVGAKIGGIAGPIGGLVGGVIGGLLGGGKSGLTKEDRSLETFFDYLLAYRYCIGIRDLGLYKRVYAQSSRLVSLPRVFSQPVEAASIIVSEVIPDTWDNTKRWIMYEISHDGTNWQEVHPMNTNGSVGAVVKFPATTTLHIRITMSRPDDKPTESPILEYYAIQAVPQGTV